MFIWNDKIDIIMHRRKSLFHHNNTLWVKNGDSVNFDITMVGYDGADICELVGCFLPNNLNEIIDPSNHGLYRDDGSILVDKYSPRKGDLIRKKLPHMFSKFEFKLDIENKTKVTSNLDINLDLRNGTLSPSRKINQQPIDINVGSNHPKHVWEQIPNDISFRLSSNSSSVRIFNQHKNEYEKP